MFDECVDVMVRDFFDWTGDLKKLSAAEINTLMCASSGTIYFKSVTTKQPSHYDDLACVLSKFHSVELMNVFIHHLPATILGSFFVNYDNLSLILNKLPAKQASYLVYQCMHLDGLDDLPEAQKTLIIDNKQAFLSVFEQLNQRITQYQTFCDTPSSWHTFWGRMSSHQYSDEMTLEALHWLRKTLINNIAMSDQVITAAFKTQLSENPALRGLMNMPVIKKVFEIGHVLFQNNDEEQVLNY